jgi:transcriptional regulator with XRE-family HTH domain
LLHERNNILNLLRQRYIIFLFCFTNATLFNKKLINMKSTLNTELLARMLKNKRVDKGLRAVANEIGGVSAATLSRIEQGKIPDVDTFIRICKWLNVTTDTFIIGSPEKKSISTKDLVVAHLRAERELSKDTVTMLIKMIDLAYSKK